MKVTKTTQPKKVEGKATELGELYIFDGTGHVYFRHISGLVNLETGENQPLDTVVSGLRFTHQPGAELVIP